MIGELQKQATKFDALQREKLLAKQEQGGADAEVAKLEKNMHELTMNWIYSLNIDDRDERLKRIIEHSN